MRGRARRLFARSLFWIGIFWDFGRCGGIRTRRIRGRRIGLRRVRYRERLSHFLPPHPGLLPWGEGETLSRPSTLYASDSILLLDWRLASGTLAVPANWLCA